MSQYRKKYYKYLRKYQLLNKNQTGGGLTAAVGYAAGTAAVGAILSGAYNYIYPEETYIPALNDSSPGKNSIKDNIEKNTESYFPGDYSNNL